MNIALHLRHPTFSLKINTAPKVIKRGTVCKIEDMVDSGIREIAATIRTAPIISEIERVINNLLL